MMTALTFGNAGAMAFTFGNAEPPPVYISTFGNVDAMLGDRTLY